MNIINKAINRIKTRIIDLKTRWNEVNIRNMCFGGEDMYDFMRTNDGMLCDPRVHGWKRYVKNIGWIAKQAKRFTGTPKITKDSTLLLDNFRIEYLKRAVSREQHILDGFKDMVEHGLNAPTWWDSHALNDCIDPFFQGLIGLNEGDPFYEHAIMDGIFMIGQWGERSRCLMDPECAKCTKPTIGYKNGQRIMVPRVNGMSGWLDVVIQDMNDQTLALLANHVNWRTKQANCDTRITGISYDKDGKIRVTKTAKVAKTSAGAA